jgi:hypothetical protein
MPLHIHPLVQYAHDPNAVVFGYVKHHVRLMHKPPQTRREFASARAMHRVFRQSLELFVQAR